MDNAKSKIVKKYRAGNITAAFGADLLVMGSTSIPNLLLEYYSKLNISDSEMMLLIQLIRQRTNGMCIMPDLDDLSETLNGNTDNIKYLFNGLLDKQILSITQYYDYRTNSVVEGLDFEPLFEKISELWACDKVKEIEETKNLLENSNQSTTNINQTAPQQQTPSELNNGAMLNICTIFEREFARPLSPMEVERIQHWITETDTVIIMEALRRAVLMGKNNFRYIDAIIMEWRKNKLLTLQDIEKYDQNYQQRRAGVKKKTEKISSETKEDKKKMYDALLMS